MSKPPDHATKLSETLTLCEYKAPENWHYQSGNYGFWLWDDTRGMNLAMRAPTAQAAFVDALTYYQRRLLEVEKKYATLEKVVAGFRAQLEELDED